MLTFPKISNPSYPFKIRRESTSITSKFEDGTVQSRTKFTRSRSTFILTWDSLTQEEFDVLDDFIVNSAKFTANSFSWENPVNGFTYTVRCTSYGEPEMHKLNYWRVNLELTEV